MAGLYDAMIGAGASGASNGWAKVGDAIGTALGGGAGPKTYMETMSRGHEMQRKLAEAKIKTDELNAREKIDQSVAGLFPEGDPRAGALAGVMRAGFGNFDQGTQGLGNIQDQGLKEKALAAMTGGGEGGAAPDANLGNAILSVLQGKPVDLTKVSGGTAYNPMVTPDKAQLQTTPAETRALDIRETRANGQNQADIERARKPSAARGGGTVEEQQAKWYAAQLKKAAQGALTDAKLKGYDVTGLGIADAMAMLENNGEFTTLDGHTLAKWTIKKGDLTDEPGNDVPVDDTDIKAEPGAPVTEPKTPAAAAMSGDLAPAVPVATRIAQAKAALAAGKDPAQVRQLLGSMGINPAAAGL